MKQLVKESVISILIATGIFGVVVLFLHLCGWLISPDGHLTDPLLPLELVAGIIGSAYILMVRNPQNFLGFVAGIIMSILLGIQFYLQDQIEQTLLYYMVFIPCETYTLVKWIRGRQVAKNEYTIPSFLGAGRMIVMLIIFIIIVIAVLTFLKDEITLAAVMSAMVVGSSTLANFLMIRKRTDAWIYWMVSSVTGIIFLLCMHNYITLTMYVVYLFINGSACIAWIKQTPKDRRGWLMRSAWKRK